MPTVERVRGRGLVRGIGRFEAGDRAEVSEDDAAYLVEENGDFRIVDDGGGGEDDTEPNGDDAPEPVTHTLEETIDNGLCPWCEEYEGENVAQHASSAHPDEWDDYKEA